MPEPLLLTKLYLPPQRLNLVPRPKLINQLNLGLQLSRKFTLISAPAGFGKTTLTVEWIHQKDEKSKLHSFKVAWLSLDEADNDPIRFLTYFITALNQVEGRDSVMGKEALSMLQLPQPSTIDQILISLINDISTTPDKIILVLDDYHVIESSPVDEAFSFLLDHLPPQLHLVIATRDDPQFPLARLRARGQLTELRAADLRFTSSEAAEFLNQVMGLALSAEDITALETRTEGWIAGLQLAALSMQGHQDTSSRIQTFTGSHRFVLDYLIEEVLEQQSENVQTFLLKTAVLNQLSGPLCNALTGQSNSQATLEMLDRNNLFIVPLDEERHWYRYHHLFADLLRQRLRQTHPEQIPELHQQASQWYEQENRSSEAIRHAFAAENFERVADLAELVWPAWSDNVRSLTWHGWVKNLPKELVQTRPVLSIAYAQTLLNGGQLEAADSLLRHIERWLEKNPETSDQSEVSSLKTGSVGNYKMDFVDEAQFQTLPAWLATTRAYHAQAIGDIGSTVTYVKRALDLFPEDDLYNRAAVTGLMGLAYWASGDLNSAYQAFANGLFQNVHDRIKGTFVLADMQKTLGHLREAERICEHGFQLAKEFADPMPMGTEDIYSAISEIHREQGQLETAAKELRLCKKLGDQRELPDWHHRWCIAQSRLEVSLGNLDLAIDLLDEALLVYVRTPVPETRPITAMKARIWATQGRLAEALAWMRERSLSVDDELSYMREFEHVTLVKILLSQYQHDQIDEPLQMATGLLKRLLAAAEAGGRMGNVIEILMLQALAFEAHGKRPAAIMSLERALTLAEPEGYHQLFVDEGPPMAQLLKRIIAKGNGAYSALPKRTTGYIHILLTAFGKQQDSSPFDSAQTKSSSPFAQPLLDPLSDRELEVLQLIAEGLTNPEIATKLFLTLNTVKVHTRNIYSKLDVHTRTQAVARARALDILFS